MKEQDLKKIQELTESFINEVEKNKLNEGFSDTAKAKWAGLKGGIKGFGKQIQGNVNKATGNILNKGINYVAKGVGADPSKSTWAKSAQGMAAKGQSQIDTGKNLAYNEKYNTYIKSVVDSIVNDLQDLNITVNNKSKLVGDIKNSITANTKQPANTNQKTQPKQTTAPAKPTNATVSKAPTSATQAKPANAPVSTPAKPTNAPASAQSTSATPTKSSTPPQSKAGKKVAGQWLSPTERVSFLGPQQGNMKVTPDDPSQVENPYSPRYNKAIADKRVANAQKNQQTTQVSAETQPEVKQEKSVDLNLDAKKKQARQKVMSKMGK
jgi:hypothetical protein